MSVHDKINKSGPRKLLTLDGGGIRGMITIEVLAALEAMLQEQLHRGDDFVLAEYFDYIAGTSTGAIIATCLALGKRVDEIRDFYISSGPAMFDQASLLRRYTYHKFEDEKLAAQLQEVIGADTTLGSDKLETLLMIVMRNATTDSPWMLSNNPSAKYNDPERGDHSNLKLPLWQLVRASTAAPVYFPPEVIRVGEHDFTFVDGGVTMYNNPAFQLFLMATTEPYKLCWPTGEQEMLLVSIGTGTSPKANDALALSQMHLGYNVSSIPSALMYAALNEQDFLCRVFGKCLCGDELDREIGDMIGQAGPAPSKLFTYMRYNAALTTEGLTALGLGAINPDDVRKLDSTDFIASLQSIGRAVARKIQADHFAGFLP